MYDVVYLIDEQVAVYDTGEKVCINYGINDDFGPTRLLRIVGNNATLYKNAAGDCYTDEDGKIGVSDEDF